MNEKLVAGIITAAAVAPVCAVCVLGSAAVGSLVAAVFAWLGGAGPLLTLALMVATGVLVHRTLRRRHQLNKASGADPRAPHVPTMENRELGAPGTGSGARSAQQGERS